MKLKFDRALNIKSRDRENTTIPKDEVWRGTLVVNPATSYGEDEAKINDMKIINNKDRFYPGIVLLGGGTVLHGELTLTGVVFKVVE